MLDCTIIIPTRNRQQVLEHSLAKIRKLFPAVPILVYDDASEDAAGVVQIVEAVQGARCIRGERCVGPAGGRMLLMQAVQTSWCLALDDDCYPREDFNISRWLGGRPEKGDPIIIGFRFFRPYDGDLAPPGAAVVGSSQGFHGGASLLHCSSVLAIGGYRDFLFFGGEDTELAYRVWASGYQIWIDTHNVVVHEHVACGRDIRAESYFYVRNRILINILTVPLWLALPLGTLQALRRAFYHRDLNYACRGLFAGYRDSIRYFRYRKILSFSKWLWLRSLNNSI